MINKRNILIVVCLLLVIGFIGYRYSMFLGVLLLAMAAGYLLIITVVTALVTHFIKQRHWRWVFGGLLFMVLLFLPFADQIIGRLYFDHLCDTEAGLHVYQTVELGPEYYHEDGSPRFIDDKGRFDGSIFGERYEFKQESKDDYVTFVHIKKRTDSIIDTNTDDTLGTFTNFFYFGGWLANYFSPGMGGISCGVRKGGYHEGIISHILIPASGIPGAER